jgi:hypothetical protein
MDEYNGYFIGILWAAQFVFTLNFVSNSLAKKILVSTMWFVVGLFLFNQITEFNIKGITLESIMFLLQVGLIFMVKKFDFRLLALAFFIHGSWDIFHLFNQDFIQKPVIFSQICVPYDWLVAAYILWRKWEK